ncbi:hypothetical protein [Desulfotomaculum copahuensis]|uniref:Uncharacterized protein n=1 Tax=Desulfotomaculum copahuensis TaxID=1838280 RepID=A0A1B7LGB5_9FIRM|nr:hypothetical protein [Desulfotomaculum copahuensis]OAT85018.1 hypothetical protein A6M21_07285 [Desulfotomaculum copahuensis]
MLNRLPGNRALTYGFRPDVGHVITQGSNGRNLTLFRRRAAAAACQLKPAADGLYDAGPGASRATGDK